ncbi:MAG: hypothetical protein PHV30_03605 [Candidatus Margulisbacteria bacterium]|nr:hypothetical protein [Candidatus Margulisiibacteriota bacterium]
MLKLSNGFLEVKVDPEHGGRISTLNLAGMRNVFYTPAIPQKDGWINNGGDFLWIAPQERWGWPPIAEFDKCRWDIYNDEKICLISPVWQGIQLQRELDFADTDTLQVTNTLINQENSQSWGLWNISQIPLTGLEITADYRHDIKVFSFPKNVDMDELIKENYLKLYRQKKKMELFGKKGKDYKLGCVSTIPKMTILTEEYILEKRFELDTSSDIRYPHDCNLEFYKNDDYMEAEVLWPMVSLEPGQQYRAVQYFSLQRRQ